MRVGTLGILGLLLASTAPSATANAATSAAQLVPDDGSLALPGGVRARPGRNATFAAPARLAAWSRLEADTGTAWASWDPDTAVPSRILLEGVAASDVIADPAAAAAFSEDFLTRHIDLLAPGASPSDFTLVTNDLSAGMRTIGFVQHHAGLRVLGGQVSFRFKNDRLILIGSEAFPNVAIASRGAAVAAATAATQARTFVQDDVAGRHLATRTTPGTAILPVIERGGAIHYHEVVATEVELDEPRSRFDVWVDAKTGAPVARRSTLHYGDSQVFFNVPEQGPLGARYNALAPLATYVGGETSPSGIASYPGSAFVIDFNGATGPLIDVANSSGPVALASFTANDGVPVVWNAAADESVDAQLSAFIHASIVKSYVRAIDPNLGWLDQQLPVTVNIDDSCNAFSDGNSINFYLSSDQCENTGRLADVVYHEFGHSVHTQSILPGVGQFNGSLSEGISDYLAATMTGDSGLGRGFFFNDSPLRDFDPPGFEYRWPEDRGEVHEEGRIIGGALWDLRTLMIGKLGAAAGIQYTDRLWYETTRRAVDIPSMYAEALAFDDDDGNLANGTPNGCEINAAYGPHGLFTSGEGNERVSINEEPDGTVVQLLLSVPNFPGCPITAAPQLEWRLREDPGVGDGFPMAVGPEGSYTGLIPPQTPGTVVQYQVRLNYSNGAEGPLPDNFVDPWYETFIGDVVPLRCLGEPWPTTIEGANGNWVLAPMQGDSAGSDPGAGFDGGTHLYQPGPYAPFSNSTIHFDPVATAGYTNVRLQYQRWLTVEDGHFDEASILADDLAVWTNHGSDDETQATFHHIDKEWRFHDVDLSDFVADGVVDLSFAITSDQGLEFGGWNIAAMCVVAFDEGQPFCGNGVVDPGEECDDANVVPGDGCSATCTIEGDSPSTTDGPTGDPGSGTGPGSGTDGDADSDTDGDSAAFDGSGLLGRGCACSARGSNGPSAPPLTLVIIGFFIVLSRRRGSSSQHPE